MYAYCALINSRSRDTVGIACMLSFSAHVLFTFASTFASGKIRVAKLVESFFHIDPSRVATD